MQVRIPHIKVFVSDLNTQIDFYAGVIGKSPAQTNECSAVWVTDDPSLRFEIAAGADQSRRYFGAGLV